MSDDPETIKDFLSLADIGNKEAAEGGGIGFKEVISFVKELSQAFKDGKDLIYLMRGGSVSEEIHQHHNQRPPKESPKGNSPRPLPPSPEDEYSEMLDKGIVIMEYVKTVAGDIPLSQVIEVLKQLKGGLGDEKSTPKIGGEATSNMRTKGIGEDGTCEAPIENGTVTPDL